jgi:glycosyltransferase involved in cell wall biosynthesis
MNNIVFLNSHPIQYFAPLYKELTLSKKLDVQVWYASDHGINDDVDLQFGRKVKWDIPMLDGYNYLFLKNNSRVPGINNGFFGLINFDLFLRIKNLPKSTIIVIPGWNYLSYWFAFAAAFLYGKRIAFRSESPLSHEKNKSRVKRYFRHVLFRYVVFKRIDFAFYIGSENLYFYNYFKVDHHKLIYTPYSVDNVKFQQQYDYYKKTTSKANLRVDLNIPVDKKVILYSGKFIHKKNPLDIIRAFATLQNKNSYLILMGDGELGNDISKCIDECKVNDRVLITGFINQSEISKYYFLSDVLVMASGYGETWGLSVNEAMNFKLPIIVSDIVGCSKDLVIDEYNGYVFQCGNISDLNSKLETILNFNQQEIEKLGDHSRDIINKYSYQVIRENLEKIGIID